MKAAVTTRYAEPAKKPFAWSYTKLKNFEACPKRHWHYDIAKDFKEPESEQLRWGNEVHKHLEKRVVKGTPLPKELEQFEPWAARMRAGEGTIFGEQQLAIDAEFKPCLWFDKRAWYRAKADVMKINRRVGIVVDWKTGKIIEDSVQLMLTAACMFAHYPDLHMVRSMYVWLAEDADTTLDISRDELPKYWAALWPRIEALRQAHENTDYPPTPNRLCRKWCIVTSCPHHGGSYG